MNHRKRGLSLLLALLLMLSLLPAYAWAAEVETEETAVTDLALFEDVQPSAEEEPPTQEGSRTPDEPPTEPPTQAPDEPPTQAPDEPPTQAPDELPTEAPTQAPTEAPTQDPVREEEPVSEPATAAEPEREQEPDGEHEEEPDREPATQPTQPPTAAARVPAKRTLEYRDKSLSMSYDDRVALDKLAPGYAVLEIKNLRVDSRKVVGGKVTSAKDTAVVAQRTGKRELIACGTGVASVLLVPSNQLQEARLALAGKETVGEDRVIPCLRYRITVKRAKLSLFFLAGQSNMEGLYSGGSYRESVACKPGTVYSTYIPAVPSAKWMTGTAIVPLTKSANWANSVRSYLPESLMGTKSLAGKKLVYSLNALTEEGNGKTGMDGALGYEWNRLTGEKVWMVNVAWAGSSIRSWVSGGTCCQRATAAFTAAAQVLQAETTAGHYTVGRRLLFWLQGEADKDMDADQYAAKLRSVFQHFRSKCAVQYVGMIAPRACVGDVYQGERDLALTGPRIAQYAIAASSTDARVYMVSNENERWVTDRQVKAYFAAAYPQGCLNYPMHRTGTLALPTSESRLHANIHYTQLGHNENGFCAARGMYNLLKGNTKPDSVTWLASNGKQTASLLLPKGSGDALLQVSPVYAAKVVRYQNTAMLSYDSAAGKVTLKKGGSAVLKTTYGGAEFASLQVNQCTTPSEIKTVNVYGGVQVSWKAVKGAAGYRVFCREGNGKLTVAGDTKSNSFVVKKLTSGKLYTFTVRCINEKADAFTSSYNAKGVSITYVGSPSLRPVKVDGSTVTLSWYRPAGASRFRVFYRRAEESRWQTAATTDKTSAVLTNIAPGNYVFTVRCLAAKGNSYISGYYEKGVAFQVAGKVKTATKKPASR